MPPDTSKQGRHMRCPMRAFPAVWANIQGEGVETYQTLCAVSSEHGLFCNVRYGALLNVHAGEVQRCVVPLHVCIRSPWAFPKVSRDLGKLCGRIPMVKHSLVMLSIGASLDAVFVAAVTSCCEECNYPYVCRLLHKRAQSLNVRPLPCITIHRAHWPRRDDAWDFRPTSSLLPRSGRSSSPDSV